MDRPCLIGLAGGSGCGKTHLARRVRDSVPEHVSLLSMDQYFRTEVTGDPLNVNFDHPAHLDLELMIEHLLSLRGNEDVMAPAYDFRAMHQRPDANRIEARPFVLVDGLFVLAEPFASLMDLTFFLDVADDQRLLGRILRDLEERDAKISEVIDRYQRFVRPSYNVFVAPTKQNADLVVDFTYRRAFLGEVLIHLVRDTVAGVLDIPALLTRLRGHEFQIGYGPDETIMPSAVDIRELARAFPETEQPRRRAVYEEPLLIVGRK